MKTPALLLLVASLAGCASNDYTAYSQAQSAIAQAKASADTSRYEALSKIAESGTDSARIAAVMALALGNQAPASSGQAMAAPQPSQALQWAQVLAPSITSIAGMHYASRASMASAESAARVSESTNSAFVGLASKIQAPVIAAPVLPAANVSTVTTTTNNANQANTTSTANQANTTTSNPMTVTLSGTGVVGSGTATNSANPTTTTTTTTTNPATTTPAASVCSVDAAGVVNCTK